jgi:hypothetical protein
MLATKGVFNELRTCPVEMVRVVGEETDVSECELKDGEETPVAGKDGDAYPVGQMYVLKAGPETSPVHPDLEAEQRIESNLRETMELWRVIRIRSGQFRG